jgi:hypothetical protein
VGIKDAKAKTSPENKEKLKKAKFFKLKDSKFHKQRKNRTKPLPLRTEEHKQQTEHRELREEKLSLSRNGLVLLSLFL